MNLLIPGRHLVNTRFQDEYLRRVMSRPVGELHFLGEHPPLPERASLDTIIFAVTSSNVDNSRFNPVSYEKRILGVDRFAMYLADELIKPRRQAGIEPGRINHLITGISDYGRTDRFAELTLKEIFEKSEGVVALAPENTVVLSSTPSVIALYQNLGFAILPAELEFLAPERYSALIPIEVVRMIAEAGQSWASDPRILGNLSSATLSVLLGFPEVPKKIIRLFNDPILTDDGSLTETRDYGSYIVGMGNKSIIDFKYNDIRQAIKPGKIVDHGCADGGLIAKMVHDFPDSDFYGIDASAAMIMTAEYKKSMKAFGKDTYVDFRHGNIINPLFTGPTANTITSLSLLHEVWSYGAQQKSLDDYVGSVHSQLVPGGRFVVRDVVGPEDKAQEVYMWCNPGDGSNSSIDAKFDDSGRLKDHLDGLSTSARFRRFAEDFLSEMRAKGRRGPETVLQYRTENVGGIEYFVLRLKDAAEFMLTKDYTDNWESEMNEEFTFKSFSEWKEMLGKAGFTVIETPNEPQKGSRVYTNPWMVDHVFAGKVKVYNKLPDGTLKQMDWPVTNMVLVGEKR